MQGQLRVGGGYSMKCHRSLLVFTCFLVFFLVNISTAVAIPIEGSGSLGSFEGTFDYNPSTATLDVSLTNTSPDSNGGYLTAFAFLNPNDAISDVTFYSSTSANFGLIGGPSFDGSINVQPYGYFDIGASSTGNQWQGGGDPKDGIGVGDTESFQFIFAGTDLDQLTTLSFFNEDPAFLARFRGFEDGESDKVSAAPVPEPSTILLLGLGLVGLAGFGRKKIKS